MKGTLLFFVVCGSLLSLFVGQARAEEKLTPEQMKEISGRANLPGHICQVHNGDACENYLGVAGPGECTKTEPLPYSECVTDNNPPVSGAIRYCNQVRVKTCKRLFWNPANANGEAIGATPERCRTGPMVAGSLYEESLYENNGC
jgi:hypothetical protein